LLSLVVPLCFVLITISAAPLGTALEFGTDEGYELMKGFLLSRGYSLYSEIWSDQPPLHTELLAFLFKLFGPSALVARLLSVGFAALALWSFYELIRSRSGIMAAWIGAVLLALSPYFLQLSVSAMIVLPAMALGLFSVWILFRYRPESRRWLLFCSGIAMGLALQIKLATALFIPALVIELFLVHRRASEAHRLTWHPFVQSVLVWGVGVALGFGCLWALFPAANADLLLGTHFSEQTRTAFEADSSFRHFHEALWYDLGASAAAVAGLGWILLRRLWKLLFPAVLLITVYLFHCFHRPYWHFHYLHFAIPLAWLSAIALKEFGAWLLNAKLKQFVRPPFSATLVYLLWAGFAALLLSDLPKKAAQGWTSITAVPLVDQDPLVGELQRHAHQTKWVVVDRSIYAFHAGVPVPPPLAVVSQKRVRSGRFTPKDLLATIIQYKPGLVACQWQNSDDEELNAYLSREYVPLPGSNVSYLLVRKEYGQTNRTSLVERGDSGGGRK
jgi:4-amino-4-deoxy-L-arabinose transferase-like glycosyltransferase